MVLLSLCAVSDVVLLCVWCDDCGWCCMCVWCCWHVCVAGMVYGFSVVRAYRHQRQDDDSDRPGVTSSLSPPGLHSPPLHLLPTAPSSTTLNNTRHTINTAK